MSSTPWTSSRFPITTSRKGDPRAPLREEARGSRVLHREFAQEEMQEEISWVFTTGSSVMQDSERA